MSLLSPHLTDEETEGPRRLMNMHVVTRPSGFRAHTPHHTEIVRFHSWEHYVKITFFEIGIFKVSIYINTLDYKSRI